MTGIVSGPFCATCGLARLRGEALLDTCDVPWCQTVAAHAPDVAQSPEGRRRNLYLVRRTGRGTRLATTPQHNHNE